MEYTTNQHYTTTLSGRPYCWDCVYKHIAQAYVLLSESEKGYPEHRFLAWGHLAEAEDEAPKMIGASIREWRLRSMKGERLDFVLIFKELEHRKLSALGHDLEIEEIAQVTDGKVVGEDGVKIRP